VQRQQRLQPKWQFLASKLNIAGCIIKKKSHRLQKSLWWKWWCKWRKYRALD
jgi:hypothetical protein